MSQRLMVGTPRCGVRSAQRADPTIRARQPMAQATAECLPPFQRFTQDGARPFDVFGQVHGRDEASFKL
jgi:hypothetical protein